MEAQRNILITTALPYANGPIHLGHMVEYIQADIWARFQNMQDNTRCYFFCADDTHGTPILIRAKKEGRTPESVIEEMFVSHQEDFQKFGISFDHYSSTHSPTNREWSEKIYLAMRDNKHLDIRPLKQAYCPNDKMFLPDRFIKGTCPKCSATNQYGDSCDVCGSTYATSELKESACSICGTKPTLESSDHIFFKLNNFKEFLQKWVPAHNSGEISKKLNEWLQEDLRDWDISRDEPYFGFKIPGYDNKYFYVWVDAPVGYIATSNEFFKNQPELFEKFWLAKNEEQTEVYHFIGKDIVYFHSLFWPAMLHNAGLRTPTGVNVHGFLTVNGEKMSKSKGTFVNANTYLKHLDPSYLRYYYACKLSEGLDDIDMNLEDFTQRVNSDLIGKYINLGSRSAQMLHKNFGGKITQGSVEGQKILAEILKKSEDIRKGYEKRQYSKVLQIIRESVDQANKYFDEVSPWKIVKENPEAAQECLSSTLWIFRALSIYLAPVVPVVVDRVQKLFGESTYKWKDLQRPLSPITLNPFQHLLQRVDADKVKLMIEDSKGSIPATTPTTPATVSESGLIEIEDFNKIDLRVAKIISAEDVVGTDKMLKLQVQLDSGTKTIFAGIKKSYSPDQLIGLQVLVVANLKPRKMKFGTSEGMVLCASAGDKLFVLSPQGDAVGSKVK